MTADPNRADALRELIARVEAGAVNPYEFDLWEAALGYEITSVCVVAALMDSLDAVASLEAPLRERGWSGPWCSPDMGGPGVYAEWCHADTTTEPCGIAPTEPRARLLAVLRAMLHEEAPDA